MSDPFASYQEETDQQDMKKLLDLISQMRDAEVEVLAAQDSLKAAQKKHRELEQFTIPEFMDELGLSEVKTADGLMVKVVRKLRASIGKNKAQAFSWLVKNNHDGIIKRTVAVAFNRDQAEEANELTSQLQGRFAGVKQDMKVEASTLTSFVREQMEKGVDIPQDIFGVMEQRFAQVKQSK